MKQFLEYVKRNQEDVKFASMFCQNPCQNFLNELCLTLLADLLCTAWVGQHVSSGSMSETFVMNFI